jgi:hypothetical protein
VPKIAKTHGGCTSFKSLVSKPLVIDSPRPLSAMKGAYDASALTQRLADQSVSLKKKEVVDKEVLTDLRDPKKKFWVSTSLDPK